MEYIDTKYFVQVDGDFWLLSYCMKKMETEDESAAFANADSAFWFHNNGEDIFRKVREQRPFVGRYDFVTYFWMVQPRFYRTECVKKLEVGKLTP